MNIGKTMYIRWRRGCKMKKIILLVLSLMITTSLFGCSNQALDTAYSDPISNPEKKSFTAKVEGDREKMKEDLSDRRPMVMINGELYLDTNKESDLDGRCGVMDGEISLVVDAAETPTQDNQSNFGKGYEYQYVGENNIDIYMNEKWMRFDKKITDPWGIRLTATDVTSSKLTLVCEQLGGEPTGELETGGYYFLEKNINEQWLPVEMLQSEDEVAWTQEAWIIPMNNTIKWDVDWVWLYGELPVGGYRVGKEIMDFRETGNYDENIYYANFEVTN